MVIKNRNRTVQKIKNTVNCKSSKIGRVKNCTKDVLNFAECDKSRFDIVHAPKTSPHLFFHPYPDLLTVSNGWIVWYRYVSRASHIRLTRDRILLRRNFLQSIEETVQRLYSERIIGDQKHSLNPLCPRCNEK